LLATGGTVNCVSKLLESNKKEISGLIVVIELTKLEGRLKFNFPIESSISYWNFLIINIINLFENCK